MPKNSSFNKVTRRNVLGGLSAGLALTAVPGVAYSFGGTIRPVPGSVIKKPRAEATLAKYLCDEVHGKIASRLDRVISDLTIDGEQTSLALMQARCPGCGERVEPATARISVVIPQWKQHIVGPQKYGVWA